MKTLIFTILIIVSFTGCLDLALNTIGHIASGKGKSIHNIDVTTLKTQNQKDAFLRQALIAKNLSKMQELIEVGANVDNKVTYYTGSTDITPLIEVCNNILKDIENRTFYLDVIELLLSKGANPNQTDPQGKNPLMILKGSNPDAIDILIKYGAKSN